MGVSDSSSPPRVTTMPQRVDLEVAERAAAARGAARVTRRSTARSRAASTDGSNGLVT